MSKHLPTEPKRRWMRVMWRAPIVVLFATVVAGLPLPAAANQSERTEAPAVLIETETDETNQRVLRLSDLLQKPAQLHHEVLAGLPADDPFLGASGNALLALREELDFELERQQWATEERRLRTGTVRAAATTQRRQQGELETASVDRELSESNLLALSVDAFVNGSDAPDFEAILAATNENSSSKATQELRSTQLVAAASTELILQRDEAVAVEVAEQRELDEATAALEQEEALLAEADRIGSESATALQDLEPRIAPAERAFERDLLMTTMPGTKSLQVVAVNAYYSASEIAHQRWPQCRVTWNQLAGVGRVESFHGNFGRSSINYEGQTSPRILGPQLNGDPWLAIPDSDGGRLDGDTVWDRAVGPMQFIPTSWKIFGADGNGDGVEDPHNLYDAAVAAADHLCGSGLDNADNFRRALLGYNRSVAYGHDVLDFSDRYANEASILDPWDVPEPTPETDGGVGITPER